MIAIKKKLLVSIFMMFAFDLRFVTTVLASVITTDEVQAAVDASGKDQAVGNVLIWFLCALGFLKLSTKMESILGALGVNTGSSGGGSILGAAMVAMRGLKAVTGGRSPGNSTSSGAAGQTSTLEGGLAGVIGRRFSDNAAGSITGQTSSSVGESMFDKSLAQGTDFSKDIISNIAKGDVNKEGSITGERAAAALSTYLGQNEEISAANSAFSSVAPSMETSAAGSGDIGQSPFSESMDSESPSKAPSTLLETDTASYTEMSPIGEFPFTGDADVATTTNMDAGVADPLPIPAGFEENAMFDIDESGVRIGSAPFTDKDIVSANAAVAQEQPLSPSMSTSISSKHESASGISHSAVQAESKVHGKTSLNMEATHRASASATVSQHSSTNHIESSQAQNDMAYGGNPSISIGDSPFNNTNVPVEPQTPRASFKDVEIGGGRITGTETSDENPDGIQFGMYHTGKYAEPAGKFSVVDTIDGAKWYKQYAVNAVEKTPIPGDDGKVGYDEKIVKQLPPVPKRKDRI